MNQFFLVHVAEERFDFLARATGDPARLGARVVDEPASDFPTVGAVARDGRAALKIAIHRLYADR